jgi:hypothetical protein
MRSLHNSNVVSMMRAAATDAVSGCITGWHTPHGRHTCRYVRQFRIIIQPTQIRILCVVDGVKRRSSNGNTTRVSEFHVFLQVLLILEAL